MNDYMQPLLDDQAPENAIEDEYKHKHKQVFCWRFLRHVSFVDHTSIDVKKFTGDVD